MTIEKLRPAFTFTKDRLRQLQQIVPEAFADGKINWEALRQALGEHLEDDAQEHFGLTWPGKREARRLAALPPQGTLVPAPGEGIDEATTHNLFIEGENLEVLKLLQKSYAGRVKLIYIDPPYNTGNDFVYEDDYSEPLKAYLKRTGQMDEAGRMLTTNPRASGRFHSRWLSMIYPRLLLARQLLREDGVIFVSIDDNEVHHLRLVMNEVFGEENFVATIVVQTNPRGRTLDRYLAKTHEYIVVYAKDLTEGVLYQIPKSDEAINEYKRQDAKGRYRELELRNRNPVFTRANRPNLFFPIYANPDTGEVSLEPLWTNSIEIFPLNSKGEEGCWTWGIKKVQSNLEMLVARQVDTLAWRVFRKDYLPSEGATTKPKALWLDKEINHERGKEELGRLFGKTPFDFPKSVNLISKCLQIGTDSEDEDIILDFFAGSCTTAHAVLAQNRQDGGKRQFIMVQLPEPTPRDSEARKAGYDTIADIGKERIRRVIRKMKEEATPAGNQPSLVAAEDAPADPLDLGFKVLKLTSSHFKPWTPPEPTDAQTLDGRFAQHASPLVEGWTKDGLLSEILLIEGFPLDSRVIPLEAFTENVVWRVHHADVAHELFVCLDEKIQPATIERLKSGAVLGREDLFICLDSALSDEAKVVLDDRLRLKVI